MPCVGRGGAAGGARARARRPWRAAPWRPGLSCNARARAHMWGGACRPVARRMQGKGRLRPMDVVVVEFPTKAKTINKYLGSGYQVLSSYGHVRDLPEKDGSVLPDEDFRIIYEPLEKKRPRIGEIARALKGARHLYLATDPDREGEAISWHLVAALNELGAINGVDVKRVVFHEITKRAVLDAMQHPRELHDGLIDAYQARRALDYLVGFTLSPVLWRKLHGARSAGRVQSVALRLICEREDEIEAFRAREYWSIEGQFTTPAGATFGASLSRLDGKRLQKFDLASEADAKRALAAILAREFAVESVEKKQVQRHPAPPFATATLQQEASRKLGFGADRTMRTAQRLFEGIALDGETVGLITYMRTDSVQISRDALAACRKEIAARYGERYLPDQPRAYRTRTKNAQEAHEAIRPTDLARRPEQVGRFLDDDQRRLYELIWKRTMASQMASALLDRVTADLASADGEVGFRATGSTIAFDGFLTLYQEGRDDPAQDEEEAGGASAGDGQGRCPAARRGHAEAAFHRAAAALQRGEPRAQARGARHRPALDLRQHHLGAAGARLRPPGEPALLARGPRPAGHGVPGRVLRPVRAAGVHRRPRGPARRRRRRRAPLEGGAARLLGPVQRRRRRGQGASRRRGHRRAQRAARGPSVPGARGRQRPAPLPALRRRPAQPQDRPLRRLHRLLELSGVPLHPAPRRQARGGGRRAAQGAGDRRRSRDRRGGGPQAGAVRALRPARRRRQPQALLAAARPRARRSRSRDRARAACAAARGRPPSGDRPADRGRHQPLRPLHQARPLRAPRPRRRRADDRHEPRDRAARRGRRPASALRPSSCARSATTRRTASRSRCTRAATGPTSGTGATTPACARATTPSS